MLTLEQRTEHLSDRANALQLRARQAKKQGRLSVAMNHLRRQKLLRTEADKTLAVLFKMELLLLSKLTRESQILNTSVICIISQ
jgi:hypothetical protein